MILDDAPKIASRGWVKEGSQLQAMSPVGTKRTWPDVRLESAFGGRAEVEFRGRQVR